MIKLTKTIDDPSGIVKKLIFEDETAIAESVVYQYDGRCVVCFSVQSGCPIGCSFCGTGKKFIRDLKYKEINEQVKHGISYAKKGDKIQLMSMSMGEPMLNWERVDIAAREYNEYHFYVSTVGVKDEYVLSRLLRLGERDEHFGLQFSLHCLDEKKRRKMLGNYPYLMSIKEIKHYADLWHEWTGKQVYYNYICTGKETGDDAVKLASIVGENHLTCSVLCSKRDFCKADSGPATDFANKVLEHGVDTSIFDPAGQDTIGGGCGQLLYTQEKLKGK